MKIFVASPVEVYEGDTAIPHLQKTNDSRFASARGILHVDAARWKEAQGYERDTWLKYNLEAHSDRNEQHGVGFANYAALPDDLGDYIELGCGPFTNTRFIIAGRKLASLTLLDPLIEDYEREHPFCTYKHWKLYEHAVTPVKSAIEAWEPEKLYDALVMTNVLSHCYDADAVFEAVRRVIKPGGWLVFNEDPRPLAPLDLYDVGHPLVVMQDIIDVFLADFGQVYRNGNYYIGRKPLTLGTAKGKKWQK
jgi:SAM-dependent methyltransferase